MDKVWISSCIELKVDGYHLLNEVVPCSSCASLVGNGFSGGHTKRSNLTTLSEAKGPGPIRVRIGMNHVNLKDIILVLCIPYIPIGDVVGGSVHGTE